ncbi:MAG: hypothetical protein ACRDL7_01895, partial [Gaiellaceae bacterium]
MLLRQMPQTLSSEAGFPVIFDSGSTKTVSPSKLDFLGDIRKPPVNLVLKGISKGLPIEGIGTVQWNFLDDAGQACHIRTEAYYVPSISLRLFSPQACLQWNRHTDGAFKLRHNDSIFLWDGNRMTIPYHPHTNLPTTYGYHDQSVSQLASALHTCVTDDINQNLTSHQKLLLRWHFCLGHIGFESLQWLARRGFLPKTIANCDRPKCASCQFGSAQRRQVGKESRTIHPKRMGGSGKIKAEHLRPGDYVSLDHYETRVKGRLRTSRGHEREHEQLCGGTIFCDHASGLIDVRNQVTLGASDTLRSKLMFERMASSHGVHVRNYRGDNGVFTSRDFRRQLEIQKQGLTLSGVGAHHQNGVAERAIKTVTTHARIMMLHAALRWPEATQASLWPFALEYAAHLWNTTPKESCGGMSPMEFFSSSRMEFQEINNAHVWGCPAYVLDPTLQDGKKLPKWQPRSRRGMFIGVSPSHSTTVGEILNLTTGSVTPQYHVVFDDWFSTVTCPDDHVPETWEDLFLHHRSQILEPDQVGPPLADEWLDADSRAQRNAQREH